MNKIFFFTFALCYALSFPAGYAQENNSPNNRQFDREKFQTRRNAFITAELMLTPEEAEKFIPLCNEFRQRKFEIGRDCRKLNREMYRRKNLTDAAYMKVIDECLEVSLKEAQLEKEYYDQFKKILPPSKLFKYRDAENKFARRFLSERNSPDDRSNNAGRKSGQ